MPFVPGDAVAPASAAAAWPGSRRWPLTGRGLRKYRSISSSNPNASNRSTHGVTATTARVGWAGNVTFVA